LAQYFPAEQFSAAGRALRPEEQKYRAGQGDFEIGDSQKYPFGQGGATSAPVPSGQYFPNPHDAFVLVVAQ
jgi:hypothetical protein